MGKMTSIYIAVLICIICGCLVSQTHGTFYIEVYERNSSPKIKLYECTNPSAPTSPRTAATNQDTVCPEVTSKRRKEEIYSDATFYLVLDPRLQGGRRLLLRAPDSTTRPPPESVFLGISVSDSNVDYSGLIGNPDAAYVTRLHNKVLMTLPTRFLGTIRFDGIVNYMGRLTNFLEFSNEIMITRLFTFLDVVDKVQDLYTERIVQGKKNRYSSDHQSQVQDDVRSAVGLLAQKLIDPCFILSYLQQANRYVMEGGIPRRPLELGDNMCRKHCMFYKTVFAMYPVKSSRCGSSLWSGRCTTEGVRRVCVCEKWRPWYACSTGVQYVPMLQCGNDWRVGVGTAAAVRLGIATQSG